VKSILNLAPTILKTDDDISVRRVDLSTELGILAYHLTKA
jgi:NADH/NAD ratio-sensing transcriptional regulator Rex